MQTLTPNEVLAAVEVLRQFNLQLKDQAAHATDTSRSTTSATVGLDDLEARILAEIQTVESITAKLLAWVEELKQRQAIVISHARPN
jgi:hypothetical protein